MVTVEGKLRAGLVHYRRDAEDAAHAVSGARTKAARTELAADLKTAAWWEGRYAVLLEIATTGRRPEELLAEYANRLPGRKVTPPPAPLPVRPTAARPETQRPRPAAGWRWALALAACFALGIALLQ